MTAASLQAAEQAMREFRLRYSQNWPLLVREVFGIEPDEFQEQVLVDVQNGERRISIRSGHGVGKTTTLALCILCQALTRFPQKTVCTAPTTQQLFDALAAEVKALYTRMPPLLQQIFVVKSDVIEHAAAPDESFISFRTSRPETPEAMAGVHSEHVLLIGDEASGIPQPVFEAASGSMSGHHATTLLAGNPVRSTGLFYDTHNKPAVKSSWKTYHVSCLKSKRVTPDFIADMKARYGENSNAYRIRVLGEFPLADDDTVIPREYAESALARDVQPTNVQPVWGLDVARFGSDKSALARRKGNVLECKIETWGGLNTMELCGRIVEKYRACTSDTRPHEILVDTIGIGSGVYDRLHELGLPVRGINVSESAALSDKFINLRAELWWKGREWLEAKNVNIAGDEDLVDELAAPRYKLTSSGKIQVESKEDMRKRGVESPNRADALLLSLAGDAATLSGGPVQRTSWNQPIKRGIKGIV